MFDILLSKPAARLHRPFYNRSKTFKTVGEAAVIQQGGVNPLLRITIATLALLTYFIGSMALAEIAYAADEYPYHNFLPNVVSAQDSGQVGSAPGAETNGDAVLTTTEGVTYYVDCKGGNDSNDGRSQGRAWKTLGRANEAELKPGDTLRFKRNCQWTGPLDASWHGTASQPIYIGAYGNGELPKIQDAYSTNVRISGSYLIIDSIHATLSSPPNPDPNCNNQPVAWKAGFAFQDGASYNVVQNSKATKLAIGIFFNSDTHHNKALYNTITDNHVVWELEKNRALGAMGVLLQGSNQEVGHNYFSNNRTLCTYNGVAESNSIELYAARDSLIHHNQSFNDRVFSELGSSPTQRAENNTFSHNLFVSVNDNSAATSRFIVTRGWNGDHGPVLNTKVVYNTVYITDPDSKGVTCGKCGKGILTLKNNILWVDREPVWSDTPFVESNNLLWSSDGRPLVLFPGFSLDPSSQIANPHFADPGNNQFNLTAQSPAMGKGAAESGLDVLKYDLAQTIVPQSGKPDVGAYQFRNEPWQQIFAIPGRIEAEHYRGGGEGKGYHDTTPGNSGGQLRSDDVDIEPTTDTSGGYDVGWIAEGEWLAYDVNVATAGTYRVMVRVASPSGSRRFHLAVDGKNVTGSLTVPWTGGWQQWVDVVTNVKLTPGNHTLRFVAEGDRFNLNHITFVKLQ